MMMEVLRWCMRGCGVTPGPGVYAVPCQCIAARTLQHGPASALAQVFGFMHEMNAFVFALYHAGIHDVDLDPIVGRLAGRLLLGVGIGMV